MDAPTTIPLNAIASWNENPRTERDPKAIEQLAANLLGQGQIMPLIVMAAPVNGLYYAIDGETRRQALNSLVDQSKLEPDHPVAVKVLDASTPVSQLMAIAIAANSLRQNMTEVDYFQAFSKLIREGMKPAAVADLFNMTTKHVRGLLALANLVPEALAMLREGKRTIGWARAMTMASPNQQQKIVARIEANNHEFQTGEAVQAELRSAGIPESSALFDPALLADTLAVDLFSDIYGNGIFTDTEAFWQLQNIEIQKLVETYEQSHADVLVVRGTRFDDTGWTGGGEPAESTAVIIVHDDGSVTTREGMIPPAKQHADDDDEADALAALLDDAAQDALDAANDDEDQVGTSRNALAKATKDTAAYLGTQARIGMRLALAEDTRLAKATVVAASLTRNGIAATPLSAIALSNIDEHAMTEMGHALTHLRDRRDRIAVDNGIAGCNHTGEMLSKLLALDEADLDILFNWTVSESCRVTLDETGASLHAAADVPLLGNWRIDSIYVDTLSNAQLRQLASDILPASEQPSDKASIRTVRQAILNHVNNADAQTDWTGHSFSWLPPQVAKLTANPAVPVVASFTPDDDASDDQATSTLLAA